MKTAIEQDKKETEITELAKKNGFKPFIIDATEKLKKELLALKKYAAYLKYNEKTEWIFNNRINGASFQLSQG